MEKSHLSQLIFSFSGQEKREIRKFLESPFFNQRRDVVELFDWCCIHDAPEKDGTKVHLFGKTDIPDQELRLRMTYLMRLLERYMAQKEFESDEVAVKLQLLTGLRKRGLHIPFERARKSFEKHAESRPQRDARYYETQFHVHWENHQLTYPRNPTDLQHLRAASVAADVAYLSLKLRLICLQTVHQTLYADDYQEVWEKEVLDIAHHHFAAKHPAIAIYVHCYFMMRFPETESHFHAYKQLLLSGTGVFSEEEMHGLFIWAVNYCVRRLNTGDRRYFQEVSDLYKPGLESGHLLENGILSQYTYHNVVAAGLQTGDHEWVNYVIHHYKNSLERQYRESAFSFNLARLEFARKNYGAVLDLLQKSNYRDVLINLATKTLLLKTYYELDEYDLLQSHLDAMLNYIRRKRVIGYHRTNYTNIIRFATKLLQINYSNKKEVAELRAAIDNEQRLTERDWFLGQLPAL
jgi:hypothetical protein